jgi:hypothetical protein
VGIDGCPYEALDSAAMPVRDAPSVEARDGWPVTPTNRMEQSAGMVRGLQAACGRKPNGGHYGLRFRGRFHRRSADGRDLLRRARTPEPAAFERGLDHLGMLRGRDKGFEGSENHRRWLERYGALLVHPPKRNSHKRSWPKGLRRWVAGLRQIVESVYDKLLNTFGLHRERPHQLSGLRARLAARVALHNFCIRLNDQLGRPRLAFADLLGW